jgi:hypothetical protein
MQQVYGNVNSKENELGLAALLSKVDPIQKFSASGSDINGTSNKAAFLLAQPTWLVGGFILTVVIIGLILLITLIASKWDDWSNEPMYKLTLGITPIGIFFISWIIQYFSNQRKDNTFDRLFLVYNNAMGAQSYDAA